MRKRLLSLATVALVASACSSSSAPSGGYVQPPDPRSSPADARPHAGRRRRRTTAPPSKTPGRTRSPTPTRIACRRSRWTSTRPRTASPSASSTTATCPTRPASGSRNGSTPSSRATSRRARPRSPSRSTAPRPRSAARATSCSGSGSRRATCPSAPGPRRRSRSSSTPRGRWSARAGSSWSRIPCASSSSRSAKAIRLRSLRSTTARASSCRRPGRPTRSGSSDAIDDLRPGGSTNVEDGLRLGYGLARETLLGDGGIDRIVLASDGVANVGLTDADGILRQIRDDAAAGIELVSVGVGMGNYNDALLEQLADQGDGFYAYVNDLDEARRLFSEDLVGTIQSVALDAKVQVRFDSDVVESYRLIGYENRAIADHEFAGPERRRRRDRGRPRRDGAVRADPARGRVGSRPRQRRACAGPSRTRRASRASTGRSGPTTWPIASTTHRRRSGSTPSWRRPPRPSAGRRRPATPTCATCAGRRFAIESDLPGTDQVHDFLEFLDRAAELGG